MACGARHQADCCSNGTTGFVKITVQSNVSEGGNVEGISYELSRTTSYLYDSAGRLTRVTELEGNYVATTYDARGNVTQTQAVPKSGSGLSTLTTSATYASTCTSIITCNKPTAVTDARGSTTDLQWNATHGQLDWVRSPAPTSGATRPETRYTYTQTASPVSMGSGTYLLTAVSSCQTGSSCAGTSDEVKSTIGYGTNLLPTSASSGAGDGSLTATSAMTYDATGNLLTVDGPLSGTADTTRLRYNAARERIGTVSPDPDGAGAMKMRAQKVTLDTHGLVTKVEQGTVNSQSDSDWAAFASLQAVETGYDSNLRPVTQSLTSGGTPYALTQTSYDSAGRVQCVAQRMNPAAFGSLPSDACTLGTQGSDGPDRIVKTTYDAASEVTKVTTAYGVTGVEADEVTKTYTSNGQLQTLTDGEGNKTTYVYDGLDRLSQTQYPSATKGAGTSNSSDYEQLGYDAGGNVTSRRLRDGNSIAFTYDTLNRVTAKDLPGSEPDVSYAYDLLGRMTSAATSAQTYSFTYDALGRNLTQVGPNGTLTSAWDIAGRRTRLTHPDGFYVDQDYLVTGELQHIRENGASSGVGVLATYAYDDLGRRTSLTRGNGTSTSYTFDNASRLTQIADDLSGTTYDQTLGFSYNPASEIASNTRSNDNYAWNGHYNVNRSYTSNGLNQYTASGSVTPTYDTKGNLTSAGSTTYTYSSENLLMSTNGGVALAYDPLTRLYQTSGGIPGTTRFQYDGAELVAEYNSSNSMLRRYVHGPGGDEPIIWYEGSSTTDRRFLSTDERASAIAVTNSSGTVTAVNSYDEYGIPASGNTGRFSYTGQAWLPELGMWYYKARMYSPTLGRFLQIDPIGYSDGMNAYAYVGGDPVNLIDPSGLAGENDPIVVTGHRGQCQAGSIQINNVCVRGDKTSVVVYSGNTFSFNVAGIPAINKNLPCTASGHRITCTLPPPPPCAPVSVLPASVGYGAGAHALVGTPIASASGSASTSKMYFSDGHAATTFTAGGAVAALDQYGGYPAGGRPWVLGAAAGLGGFVTASNATSQSQLQGPFRTLDIATPIIDVSISWGGDIWTASVGTPAVGGGVALYDTTTAVQSGGCPSQ
jgi:RHS repeat-associated protein